MPVPTFRDDGWWVVDRDLIRCAADDSTVFFVASERIIPPPPGQGGVDGIDSECYSQEPWWIADPLSEAEAAAWAVLTCSGVDHADYQVWCWGPYAVVHGSSVMCRMDDLVRQQWWGLSLYSPPASQ